MSTCGATTDVEVWEDDDASQTVTCLLPEDHAGSHSGDVRWTSPPSGQEAEHG